MAGYPAAPSSSQWWRTRRIAGLVLWTPLALGAAYVFAVAVQLNQIIATIYLDADAASAPVIGQLYGGSPAHRDVVLGQMGWFSTLMFELATRWLPLHRQIWEAAPYATALASAALIAWGLWRVAGRWAAAIGGMIVVCAAPRTLHLLFSLNDHSPTWFSLAVLAGLLVLFERRAGELGTVLTILAVGLAGATVGANMASDGLLIGAGVVPMLLAAAGAWVLRPTLATRRAWWLTVATVAVAGVSDALTRALMRHENVTIPTGISHTGLASGEAVASNFKLWWQSIAVLGNGDFFGRSLTFTSTLQLACAAMAIGVVIVLVPRVVWRELAGASARPGSDDESEPISATRGDEPDTARASDGQAPRIAWCIFWGSSAALLSFGFIVSAAPVDINSNRYLVGLIYASAALVPLLAGQSVPGRMAVAAGTTLFALTSLVSLVDGQVTANSGLPPDRLSSEVTRIASEEHLTVGYSGYWDAAPITWASHFRVKVFPVQACGNQQLCGSPSHYISSWYTPRPGIRTFLISDPTQPIATPPVPALGPPSAEYHLKQVTMFVYPYDIASRLLP